MDINGVVQNVEVDKELFNAVDKFELIDKEQMTKEEKYIASYDLTEENINKNTFIK